MATTRDYFAHSERVARLPAERKARRIRSQLEEPGRLNVYVRLLKVSDSNDELELVGGGADPYNKY